jgi:DNA topoisomerase I
MKLVIVESPTKAKTLSKILSKDYVIKASMGHIRDLPKSGLGVDVEKNYAPMYEVPVKAKKTLAELTKEAKESDEIILATDPDREGEAIAWHLQELLQSKTKAKGKSKSKKSDAADTKVTTVPTVGQKFGRVFFHELTPEAIQEAFKNVGEVNMDLVDAQQARRVLDRLVGYKLSPLLWKKVMFGLSAGRVQSVAVRLVVERERERQAFKSDEYWSISGDFADGKNIKKLTAELTEKKGKKIDIKNSTAAEKIEEDLVDDAFMVEAVKKTERKKNPYAPFKTSTLQQTMSNVFGFPAKKTMKAAQGLFEKGYITYHRTDSLNLSPQFITSAREYIKKEFGAGYLPLEPLLYKTKSQNAQEAHEAIRITDLHRIPGDNIGLTGEELKTYSMVWLRSIECQMNPAIYDQTSIAIRSKKDYLFRASGSIVKFDGWLAVGKSISLSDEDEETAHRLPDVTEDDKLTLQELKPEQHFTQPPARYSDATLIKKLEELGIGRPSTYAPTISTIQVRGYVEKEGRYFKPRDVAYVVNDLLVQHFSEVVDYGFTAKMEEELDEIAEGKIEWVPVIRNFYEPFEKHLAEKDKVLNKHDVTNLGESTEKCPDCGRILVYKLGKYGKFLSCSGYPECGYARPLNDTITSLVDGENSADTQNIAQDFGKCEKCETGVYMLKQGRFGKFLACSNYPKCKTTKPYLQKIGMVCPKCGEGDVIVKKAKYKQFYGCSRYPDCDWSSWKNPKVVDGGENEGAEDVTPNDPVRVTEE